MKRSEKLSNELMLSVFTDPWHGASIKDILHGITCEQAFIKPIKSAHNIIELTLHISAWMEETLSRLNGNEPGDPAVGDWSSPQSNTDKYWHSVIDKLFANANKLIEKVKNFPEEKFDELTGQERVKELGTGFSYEGLIIGLVQHNSYHSGQIALIKKTF